jgi:hypothetical protein
MVVGCFVISEIRKDNSMIRARVVLTVFTLLLVSGGEALAAMSITNRDAYERTLQITEGSDNQVIYNLLISADETIDGLCKKSCSVLLDNGIKQSFEGYEQVYIFNGRFTWSP